MYFLSDLFATFSIRILCISKLLQHRFVSTHSIILFIPLLTKYIVFNLFCRWVQKLFYFSHVYYAQFYPPIQPLMSGQLAAKGLTLMMLRGNTGEEFMSIMLLKIQLGTPRLRLKERILFLS